MGQAGSGGLGWDRAQGTGDVTILSSQGVEQSYEAVSELELEREGCR